MIEKLIIAGVPCPPEMKKSLSYTGQKKRSLRSKIKSGLDSDDEDRDEDDYDIIRNKMLNGERIKQKGSVFDSFTSTQQKDIIKMKQENRQRKRYALMVYRDGNYEEVSSDELNTLK